MAEVWIINRGTGQIGNRLMFFAAAYAWCLHEGHDLYCPSLGKYAEFFPALAGQLWPSPSKPQPTALAPEMIERIRRTRTERIRLLGRFRVLPGVVRKPSGVIACALSPTDESFPPARTRRRKKNYLLAWRFFNPIGIQRHRESIIRALTPRPDLAAATDQFIAELEPGRMLVGVHIRRTDYRGFLGGKHFHEPEVYRQQMLALAERFKARRPQFIVFSDEPRRMDEFPGVDVRISGGDMISDLLRMTRMHVVLGPMSSFSAFAMYLGGGIAWHFGPHAAEDQLEWVYHGYPVVHTLNELELALADRSTIVCARAGEPGFPINLRPRKGGG
ncbi:MAG: hypothetical protein ACREJO_08395 [Phycisphaerales bacterium]